MKKKLNDWLIKHSQTNISVPFDDAGIYDPKGSYVWTYFPVGENDCNIVEATNNNNNGFFPGDQIVIDAIIKHHILFAEVGFKLKFMGGGYVTEVVYVDEINNFWTGKDIDGEHIYPLDEIRKYWKFSE